MDVASKRVALETRTEMFGKQVRDFLRMLPYSKNRQRDADQLIRASGSVGANYLEATGGFSKRDFLYRIRICRKEAREARYWLLLIESSTPELYREKLRKLIQESEEIVRIFSAIAKTTEARYGTGES